MIYLDTSALTKLLVAETETPALRCWLTARLTDDDTPVTSALGRVELMRAVAKVVEPGLPERARDLLDGLDILPLTNAVVTLAESIGPAILRSLDAIHLAAAAQIRDQLTSFVTYDHRLLAGCREVGFPTHSPGAGP